jgi:hypothetical protein
MNNEAPHKRAIRRIIRACLNGYERATPDPDAVLACEHYRRLFREDAAAQRKAAERASQQPSSHNPAA